MAVLLVVVPPPLLGVVVVVVPPVPMLEVPPRAMNLARTVRRSRSSAGSRVVGRWEKTGPAWATLQKPKIRRKKRTGSGDGDDDEDGRSTTMVTTKVSGGGRARSRFEAGRFGAVR